jgi:hypothetical protein
MSHWKAFGLAIFAAVCLLGETTGSAHAAECILGQCATEWSRGTVINLGDLPNTSGSIARGINDAGQVVGSSFVDNPRHRMEPRPRHRPRRPARLHD